MKKISDKGYTISYQTRWCGWHLLVYFENESEQYTWKAKNNNVWINWEKSGKWE